MFTQKEVESFRELTSRRRDVIDCLRLCAMREMSIKRLLPQWRILRRWKHMRNNEMLHNIANELMIEDIEDFLRSHYEDVTLSIIRGFTIKEVKL